MAASKKRPLFGTSHDARYWLNTQCCGLACAVITYCLIAYAMFAIHTGVLPPSRSSWDFGHLVAFDIMAILGVVSHFRAMTTDPGAVPKHAQPPFDGEEDDVEMFPDGGAARRRRRNLRNRRCKRCENAFKPIRAHHCSICKRCVVKMDHHWWVRKHRRFQPTSTPTLFPCPQPQPPPPLLPLSLSLTHKPVSHAVSLIQHLDTK